MPTNNFDPEFFGTSDHSLGWMWDSARLSPSTNNRIYTSGLTDQGQSNSCTSRALKVAIDTFCNSRGLQFDSSHIGLYYQGLLQEFGRPELIIDNGSWMRYLLWAANTRGIPNTQQWPDLLGFKPPSDDTRAEISTFTLDYQRVLHGFDISHFRAACTLNLPVVVDMNIAWAFSALDGPLETQPSQYPYTKRLIDGDPDFRGRHAVCILDITDTAVIGANSYGPSFGNNGLFAISHEAFLANILNAYVITRIGNLQAPAIPPRLTAHACPGRESLGPQFVLNIRRALEAIYADPALTTQQERSARLNEGMNQFGVTRDEVAFSIPIDRAILDAFLDIGA